MQLRQAQRRIAKGVHACIGPADKGASKPGRKCQMELAT
jgi:hypothetical protein